jgi:hypothetical protein
MFPNLGIVALSALIPLLVGFLYYNPKTFGNLWMKLSGMTEEKIKEGNMPLIYGTAYLLTFFMGIMLFSLVVHQTDLYSLLINEEGFGVEGSAVQNEIASLMDRFGHNFRTFKHGALHGTIIGVFVALPILMTNGLLEGKKIKYGFVNAGYWIITLALMGGILCQWG